MKRTWKLSWISLEFKESTLRFRAMFTMDLNIHRSKLSRGCDSRAANDLDCQKIGPTTMKWPDQIEQSKLLIWSGRTFYTFPKIPSFNSSATCGVPWDLYRSSENVIFFFLLFSPGCGPVKLWGTHVTGSRNSPDDRFSLRVFIFQTKILPGCDENEMTLSLSSGVCISSQNSSRVWQTYTVA